MKRIIAVDDNVTNLKMVERYDEPLRKNGFRCKINIGV